METEMKKRGRPKGIFTGPRDICFVCVYSSKGEDLLVEEVLTPDNFSEEEKRNFSAENAKSIFCQKHNLEPNKICGPFFFVQRKNEKKRARKTEVLDGDFTGKTRTAICNKYQVTAFEVRDNPNAYFIIHHNPVNPDEKTSKPKDAFYSVENIEFLK